MRLPCGVLTRHAWGYSVAREGLIYLLSERRAQRFLLSRIVDRNGNAISLRYEGGRLVSVIDSVGRVVRVRRHSDGRIAAFEVKNASSQGQWTSFRSYRYDGRGDLIATVDPEGNEARYEYDDLHRLTARREPGGTSAEVDPSWGRGFSPDFKGRPQPADGLGKWHYHEGKWQQL
ncbi:uncharacterized protein SOCE26_004670 [Sorangium cellulosum]|uniref:Uncharacterized protein n=1 Tax=Sorangium cellulosum TaxID=56 RepID=A0A2L0EIG0_SORCE|nr:uncharacterized protein SOCE26_004670 [Sorangium cellulosum]